MAKIARLSVHKNNKLQKERKRLRDEARADLKVCMRQSDVAGYCIVTWSKDRDTNVCWNGTAESDLYGSELVRFIKERIKTKHIMNNVEG